MIGKDRIVDLGGILDAHSKARSDILSLFCWYTWIATLAALLFTWVCSNIADLRLSRSPECGLCLDKWPLLQKTLKILIKIILFCGIETLFYAC